MILLALNTTKAAAEKVWNFQAWTELDKTLKVLFNPHFKRNKFMC